MSVVLSNGIYEGDGSLVFRLCYDNIEIESFSGSAILMEQSISITRSINIIEDFSTEQLMNDRILELNLKPCEDLGG